MSRKYRSNTRFAAIAAAALSLGVAHVASAQTDPTPANPTPGPGPSAATPGAPAATAPASTTPAATPRISYSGLFDFYYQYDLNSPGHLSNNNLGTPLYNVRQNQPSLSLAELNIAEAANPGGFGFKATLMTGDTADINHGGIGIDDSVGSERHFKNIMQLYGTYLLKGGYGIDFGKFYTPFGYEVTESNANLNYSRSDVYSYLLPFYHAGFRAYTPNIKGFTGTVFLVNSLNNTPDEGVSDDNGSKAILGQINYTDPKGKFVIIENAGGSRDKQFDANGTSDNDFLSDTDFTYTPNATSTIGLNYVYRHDSFSNNKGSETSNGYAAYYQYAFNARNSLGARFSIVDNKDLGKPYDLTATYSMKSGTQFLTRFEYRYDHISSPGAKFVSGADSVKSSQNLMTVSEVYTF